MASTRLFYIDRFPGDQTPGQRLGCPAGGRPGTQFVQGVSLSRVRCPEVSLPDSLPAPKPPSRWVQIAGRPPGRLKPLVVRSRAGSDGASGRRPWACPQECGGQLVHAGRLPPLCGNPRAQRQLRGSGWGRVRLRGAGWLRDLGDPRPVDLSGLGMTTGSLPVCPIGRENQIEPGAVAQV